MRIPRSITVLTLRHRLVVITTAAGTVCATLVLAAVSAAPAVASSAVTQPWWQHYSAERTLNAVDYGYTLQDVQNNLDSYRAEGYQVINLDWPVSAGPTSIYNGFSASDYMHVDPRLAASGTNADTDWTNFVSAVHARGMEVTSWFNPSYFWTGSALFQQAEADVATYGPIRANEPANSPARYFKWQVGAGAVTKPCDTCSGSYYSGEWVTDPAATYAGQTISYYSVWSDQPSGDYASTEWTTYIDSVLDHWLGTGIDGLVFDAPSYYLDCNAACVNSVLVAKVHSYTNRAAFGEEPNDSTGTAQFGFDATQSTTFVQDKPWNDAISAQNPSSLETSATMTDRDRRAGIGGVDYQTLNPGVLNNDAENLLAAASIIGTGIFLTVKATSTSSDTDSSEFGDFGTWPDATIAPAFKAITDAASYNAALNSTASRVEVPTNNSAKYYAVVRTSADGLSKAIVVFNYQNTAQSITVNLAGQGIANGPTADLLDGGSGPSISGNSVSGTLPAWGYAFLGVQADAACATSLCAARTTTPVLTPLSAAGPSDWGHWGASGSETQFDHKTSGSSQISTATNVGSGTPSWYCNNIVGSSWFDGTATTLADNDTCGIYVSGNGNGFSFTVPASTTQRTLSVDVGLWEASGTFTASINDGSGTSYTDTTLSNLSGTSNAIYTLTYKATSASKLLTVTYTQSSSTTGNVTLQAATLAITPPTTTVGSLSATTSTPSGAANLTTQGSTDWMHWGSSGSATEFDFKSTGGNQISNVATGGTQVQYCGSAATFTWTDGFPNTTATADSCGIYVTGTGGSFRITVPAQTTSHTLYVYAGVWYAQASVSAVLSDGSATPYTDTTLSNSGGTTNRLYAITFKSGSPGQSLTFQISDSDAYTSPYGPGNITLEAAALS
jgi:hypothetical protein